MKRTSKKIIILFLSTLLMLMLTVGCSTVNEKLDNGDDENQVSDTNDNYPMEITDAFDNQVTIESQPKRIISLAPSHTEILFAIGLDDEIVGVTNYCNYPEAANTKEKVGDAFNINVERILELNPDLVIQYGPGNDDVNKQLSNSGIPVLSYEPESIDEIIDLIEIVGEITNKREEAKNVTTEMRNKKNSIVETVSQVENKAKVFFEIWDEPLQTAGPGSFVDELISLSGGENIASDAEGAYVEYDLEQLIERNPDVYLTSKDMETKTIESIKNRPGFSDIAAIKNNRVYLVDPLITIPGPRIVDGLEIIAKCIYPELFD